MVFFPDCKINLGLDVLRRRPDGYHDIETVMFPVRGLCDILEIVPSDRVGAEFSSGGLPVDCRTEDNLCIKAYRAVADRYDIGGVKIHLHKIVPFGAGLGGGSADAAFMVKGLSQLFSLGLDAGTMKEISAELGSDTAFFIDNVPALSTGRGEELSPIEVSAVKGMALVIIKPPFGVSTAEAYSNVKPAVPVIPLAERLAMPVDRWREVLKNDFETSVFNLNPLLAEIKYKLYDMGAVYASMSGSGSAIFGLFEGPVPGFDEADKERKCGPVGSLKDKFPDCFVYHEVID